MPKFRVQGVVTVSAWTLVEADTPEEACRIASGREGVLCPSSPDHDGGDPFDQAIIGTGDGTMRECVAGPATRSDLRRWQERDEDAAEEEEA